MDVLNPLRSGNTALISPPHLRQSINRAELQAVIDVVHRYRHRALLVAVATDSAYVHDGLQSKALQWKASGWITTRGPVINIDLWDETLAHRPTHSFGTHPFASTR